MSTSAADLKLCVSGLTISVMGFTESEKLKMESAVSVFGGNIRFFDETASTNTVLREMGTAGARDGTVAAADSQTSGRGRLGRRWVSPPGGNLYMSVLFRPHLPVSLCPASTFMASLALCETFRAFEVNPEIKWPNDIMADGKKIAGVLSEAEPEGDFCAFLVIGMGVNINLTRRDAQTRMAGFSHRVTSVSEVLGREVDRGEFAAALVGNLFRQHGEFVSKGPNWTVARWAAEWGKLNDIVTVKHNGAEIEGIARKVDGGGFLYLETPDGSLRRIVAGDAS